MSSYECFKALQREGYKEKQSFLISRPYIETLQVRGAKPTSYRRAKAFEKAMGSDRHVVEFLEIDTIPHGFSFGNHRQRYVLSAYIDSATRDFDPTQIIAVKEQVFTHHSLTGHTVTRVISEAAKQLDMPDISINEAARNSSAFIWKGIKSALRLN